MIRFALSEAAVAMNGVLTGADAEFSAVSTDTRTLSHGDLFVALKGERFDAHDHLDQACDKAVGVVVSRDDAECSSIKVNDTRLALGALASAWRDKSSAKVVGLTGSNGKTTVKEMIAAILAQVAPTLATKGNLNNDIGMPLTLMRLQDESYAVIEMGANHHGEIDYLSRICRPDVALLNNAGRAHLEGFGDLAGVAKAKSEILHGLKKNGVFVYNADDRFADQWVEKASDVKRIGFGLSEKAHVRSQDDSYTIKWLEEGCVASFDVETEATSFSVSLKLLGKHNRMNALGAISVALSLDVPVEKVQAGLASLDSVPGRLHSLKGLSQSRLIDDSYNANPESVIAAIKLLSSAPGRRILVLGDLVELGDDRDQLHAELGAAAAEAGVDVLFTCGQHIQNAHDAFTGEKHHYQQQEDLIAAMQSFVAKDDVVLVKGSRSSRMENVVSALKQEASIC